VHRFKALGNICKRFCEADGVAARPCGASRMPMVRFLLHVVTGLAPESMGIPRLI
jgi:hypothetical protein